MKAVFKLYNGLAGDPHLLLTAEGEDGVKTSTLYNQIGFFKYRRLRRLKKKLLRRLELKTGNQYEGI